MSELTQQEADILINIEKMLLSPRQVRMPDMGEKKFYNLRDVSDKEKFTIQFSRGKRNPLKATLNLMYKSNIILIRLDTGHGIHLNPDDTLIPANTPHIHIYSEDYGDSFAYELPESFSDISNLIQVLKDFFSHSKVINANEVMLCMQGGIFHENN